MYVFPSYVTKIDRSPATVLPNCSSTGSTGNVRSGVALAAVDTASGVSSSGDCGISVAGAAAGAVAGVVGGALAGAAAGAAAGALGVA